jgi:hypothetical protein
LSLEKPIIDLGMRDRLGLRSLILATSHGLLYRFSFGLWSIEMPLSQQLGEIFYQCRCPFNIAPMVVEVDRLLARRIREARQGVRKSREDLITEGGSESIGVRGKHIENKLRNQFNAIFADDFGGRQQSLNVGTNSKSLQDTINSKTYGCSG